MDLDEKITLILGELKQDNRTAYLVLKAANEELIILREENERLSYIENAFLNGDLGFM